jgi:glutathione S-transferase
MALAMRATDELYDVPVSNHGARCRFIVKLKQLESVVRVVSPSEIGGLKSDTYRELHPQGKMPLLVTKVLHFLLM